MNILSIGPIDELRQVYNRAYRTIVFTTSSDINIVVVAVAVVVAVVNNIITRCTVLTATSGRPGPTPDYSSTPVESLKSLSTGNLSQRSGGQTRSSSMGRSATCTR